MLVTASRDGNICLFDTRTVASEGTLSSCVWMCVCVCVRALSSHPLTHLHRLGNVWRPIHTIQSAHALPKIGKRKRANANSFPRTPHGVTAVEFLPMAEWVLASGGAADG